MNRVSASIAHASWSIAPRFTASRFTACRLASSGLTAFRSIASRTTTFKYSSNLDRSWASPNTLNYGFQVHLWVHSISASKCISTLARSWPPSQSLSWLNLGHQAHLQSHSILASKCLSEYTRSWLPSALPNSLDLGLQVHLQTGLILASKCISEFTRSQPSSASPHSLDCGLQVYLEGATASVWRYMGNGGGQSDGENIDIFSFPSHLIIQWKYNLYLSQHLVSLALSNIRGSS